MNKTNIKVRYGTNADINAVVAIENSAGHGRWNTQQLNVELYDHREEKQPQGNKTITTLFIAEHTETDKIVTMNGNTADRNTVESKITESKIVGFLFAHSLLGEGELLNMGTALGAQRKGIGRLLLKTWIEYCQQNQVTKLFLEVRRGNIAAQALYSNFLFKEVGQRIKYYSDTGEDALILSLRVRRHLV